MNNNNTVEVRRPDWPSIVWSGLIGGAVFLVLALVLVPLVYGVTPWTPVRYIGAIVLGEAALPPPATFDGGIFVAAAFVHFLLSVIYAIALDLAIRRLSMGPAILVGLVFGLALYLVNFYVFTGIFPWFAQMRSPIVVLDHLVFGAVTAAVYELLHASRVRRNLVQAGS